MGVFGKLPRVAPPPVVSVLSLLILGAPPDMARQRLRGARQLRRFAKLCGAYEGQVLERRSGAGVFGRDPCWETVTSLRPGDAADVEFAIARQVAGAGYTWNAGFSQGANWEFGGMPTRPALRVTLVPAGGTLARMGHLAVPRRAKRGLVLVWWHSGAPDVPGRAYYGEGRRLRYRRLLPPVVPAGSTGVLMHLTECRSPH